MGWRLGGCWGPRRRLSLHALRLPHCGCRLRRSRARPRHRAAARSGPRGTRPPAAARARPRAGPRLRAGRARRSGRCTLPSTMRWPVGPSGQPPRREQRQAPLRTQLLGARAARQTWRPARPRAQRLAAFGAQRLARPAPCSAARCTSLALVAQVRAALPTCAQPRTLRLRPRCTKLQHRSSQVCLYIAAADRHMQEPNLGGAKCSKSRVCTPAASQSTQHLGGAGKAMQARQPPCLACTCQWLPLASATPLHAQLET